MSDFTTRVHTDNQELRIELPQGMGPGDYEVKITPMEDPFLKVFPLEKMNEQQRMAYELSKELDIRLGPGFKFDRDEANSR